MLLVDHDQAEPVDRSEDRRARADADPGLAAPQPPPLVAALAGGEARVEHRDAVAEASRKRASVCGVSPISGTSTITPRPRSSAASAAAR